MDLYLLEFFSRKYPYLFFLFCFIYGTFGVENGSSTFVILSKFACFSFAWYIVTTSIVVFCALNIPITRDYLYQLLGKEFVISKVGNPGLFTMKKFGGFAASALVVNEGGKVVNGFVNIYNADRFLESRCERIEKDPDFSDKEKKKLKKEGIDIHTHLIKRPVVGPIDSAIRLEAVNKAWHYFTDVFKRK